MRFGACLWIRCREAEPRAVPSQIVYSACTGSFDWPCASPRWCPEVASSPGGLISAGPSSLRRSSSSISNAVEPSEHRGAGMGWSMQSCTSNALINTQELHHFRILRFPLTPYKFELLALLGLVEFGNLYSDYIITYYCSTTAWSSPIIKPSTPPIKISFHSLDSNTGCKRRSKCIGLEVAQAGPTS